MTNKIVYCYHCGKGKSFFQSLSFRETCDNCGSELHVCKNCFFYDESSYNECKEPSVEKVNDKEKRNICEYFSSHTESRKDEKNSQELLKQAEALFKKKSKS